jgi:hypothetical protein
MTLEHRHALERALRRFVKGTKMLGGGSINDAEQVLFADGTRVFLRA